MLDLISQLASRRFFHLVFEDSHFIIRSRRAQFCNIPEGTLFKQLLIMLTFYNGFEINDFSGEALSDDVMTKLHYSKMKRLQALAFSSYQPELRKFALTNIASVDTKEALKEHLNTLSDEKLHQLCSAVCVIDANKQYERSFMLDEMIAAHQRRYSHLELLNLQPLYPNEELLWDANQIPNDNFAGDRSIALPKLNLQFLTFHDYFLRNLTLFRLESTYEIRLDLADTIRQMKPIMTRHYELEYTGRWSRMAAKIDKVNVLHVAPPLVGGMVPASVLAEINFSVPEGRATQNFISEWDELREHDILFLVTIRPTYQVNTNNDEPEDKKETKEEESDQYIRKFCSKYGVIHVRGCEVQCVMDSERTIISDPNPGKKPPRIAEGNNRIAKVWLDPAQYKIDLDRMDKKEKLNAPVGQEEKQSDGEDVYGSLNLIIRRKAKENNFKAVMETIRDLLNAQGELKVPKWLKDVFLGYGDPNKAVNAVVQSEINFNDTFLSKQHLEASFPGRQFEYLNKGGDANALPPFTIKFPENEKEALKVSTTTLLNQGPYPQYKPKVNAVPFTPVQVSGIKSAMNEGLNLIVGPPGTGKTDVAVQIINNWYHNFPTQHTLIVTHSNQALNQIFEKIMKLDIDQRHLLRLGHGEKELDTDRDFSKLGQVDYMLQLRLTKLEEVKKLALSLSKTEAEAYTCETTEHFFTYQIMSRWEEFLSKVDQEKNKDSNRMDVENSTDNLAKVIEKYFPFKEFFADVQPLFVGKDFDTDMDVAQGCFRHIKRFFDQIADCRAFELLKSSYDRANYLLMKQAKIIAMTCTHAALKRKELHDMGFKYDNVLMEEAAQILEIETFIPLVLQNQDPEAPPRLKRVVMIGDHNQLPPVVKNMAFQKFGHLDQSLFTRFIRLGVPHLQLDSQGRTRPSIAQLYNWRYPSLGNLPRVLNSPEYHVHNPGFLFPFQFVNVVDFKGKGEFTPHPHFFQNLGEAEFVVAVFMYMRMIGYPANKITILTSYNGQKHLIREVVKKRCGTNPAYGEPLKITTVDRYQGQQNDYVLLSLVRTQNIGHIRDVRRLVVAMSRARLGLYVFGRNQLFNDCYELSRTFRVLLQRPTSLTLVKNETYGNVTRKLTDQPQANLETIIITDVNHMAKIVNVFNL
jgi:intron-binding protein aquarius